MKKFILLVILVTGLGFETTANAQDVLGGAALGVGLDNFANKLQQAIQQAIGGGLILEVGAGGQISVLISQAKAAYEADLNLTFAKLNATEQQTINSIASLVDAYEKKTFADVADLEGRALGISHSLPFSKSLPRLFQYSPEFAVQQQSGTLQVGLDGDFTDVVRRGLDAKLSLKGKSFANSTKTNAHLTFDVPFNLFEMATDRISYTIVTISVPYKESCLLLFNCDRVADFSVPIAILPLSPGTISVNYKTTKPAVETKLFVCPEQGQESVDDDTKCGGEHGDLAVHRCSPEAGYSVDPNSVTFDLTSSQGKQGRDGDWWLESNCSSATTACLCFSTEHHRFGTSGKIHFKIKFLESKPVTTDVTGHQSIMLAWEDNKIIELPAGATFTGTYVRFDGKTVNFASEFSDIYLTAHQNANILSFRTIP